jgi:positive regulator of sigma E activity
VKARTYQATIPGELTAAPGDRVEVFIPPSKAIAAGFWVLIAPLVLFVAGYFALSSLDSEPLQVAGGVAGLAIGFGVVAIRSRHRAPELPRIVALHSANDHS